jgi:hypothetical protein
MHLHRPFTETLLLNIEIPLTSMEVYIKYEDWSSVLNS